MDEDVTKRMKEALSRESAGGAEVQSPSPLRGVSDRTHPGVGVARVCRTLGELDVGRGSGAAEAIL